MLVVTTRDRMANMALMRATRPCHTAASAHPSWSTQSPSHYLRHVVLSLSEPCKGLARPPTRPLTKGKVWQSLRV